MNEVDVICNGVFEDQDLVGAIEVFARKYAFAENFKISYASRPEYFFVKSDRFNCYIKRGFLGGGELIKKEMIVSYIEGDFLNKAIAIECFIGVMRFFCEKYGYKFLVMENFSAECEEVADLMGMVREKNKSSFVFIL